MVIVCLLRNLAGHAGECPECGSRLRIPTPTEIASQRNPAAESPVRQGSGYSNSIPQPGAHPETGARPSQELDVETWEREVMPPTVWSVAAGNALQDQPMATLFARLWTTCPPGAWIGIHLRDGESMVVEQFVAKLSQASHGVFVVKAPDTTYTLAAIVWDSIARISVQGLHEMPK